MRLYRYNLKLSRELFSIISCFEVSLRNAVDRHYTEIHGNEWLLYSSLPGGIFDNVDCRVTLGFVDTNINQLAVNYSHNRLIARMPFGFWRFLFANAQFKAGGKTLLKIFPGKPKSNVEVQYNQSYVFNQLSKINYIRNRIAHHEPICFRKGLPVIDTFDVRKHYAVIIILFHWLEINPYSLLYGLDNIIPLANRIDKLGTILVDKR